MSSSGQDNKEDEIKTTSVIGEMYQDSVDNEMRSNAAAAAAAAAADDDDDADSNNNTRKE